MLTGCRNVYKVNSKQSRRLCFPIWSVPTAHIHSSLFSWNEGVWELGAEDAISPLHLCNKVTYPINWSSGGGKFVSVLA